jgi:hypothetical protein
MEGTMGRMLIVAILILAGAVALFLVGALTGLEQWFAFLRQLL